MTELRPDERERLREVCDDGRQFDEVAHEVRRILADRTAALASEVADLRGVVKRVRALADVVRRLQKPDQDSGDRDVSFFALVDALDPDDAALVVPAPAEEVGRDGE